jgi:hypothetical protein
MGVVEAKEYFRTRLKLQGYTEVYDEPFNNDGIADNYEDSSFSLNIGTISQDGISNVDVSINFPVTINLYFKSRREVQEHLDSTIYPLCEVLIADLMNVENRSSSSVKNISLSSVDVVPYETEDNERSIRASLVFDVLTFICLD